MSKKEYVSKIEFGIVYILFGFVLLFQYSRAFSSDELYLFIELMLAYVWTAGLFIFGKIQWDTNLFEPITMITVIYEGIFVVKPIIDLRAHHMTEHGISVLNGGPKATLLFVIGYTVFFIFYYTPQNALWRTACRKKKDGKFLFPVKMAALAVWSLVCCLYSLYLLHVYSGAKFAVHLFIWHRRRSYNRRFQYSTFVFV